MDQNITTAPNNLRNSKVDLLTTKNIDMKGRKVISAAEGTDPGDYVTLSQLLELGKEAKIYVDGLFNFLTAGFQNAWTAINKLIVSMIKPPQDSTSAIRIVAADGTTDILVIDSVNRFVGIPTNPPNCKLEVDGSICTTGVDSTFPLHKTFGRLSVDTTNSLTDLLSFHSDNGFQDLNLRGSSVSVGVPGNKVCFYNDATNGVLKQILASYLPVPTSPYAGIPNTTPGSVYAQVVSLNDLRAAHENLRTMVEDLRTKLLGSTLVG